MSRFPEISSLFATIASNHRTLDQAARRKDQNVDISISNLNRSLNLGGTCRVRILYTALSLMCFTAPQVCLKQKVNERSYVFFFFLPMNVVLLCEFLQGCDSIIEQSLRTIITVISASVECTVFRIDENQVLRAGGSISKTNCEIVMERCAYILQKMEGRKGDYFDAR